MKSPELSAVALPSVWAPDWFKGAFKVMVIDAFEMGASIACPFTAVAPPPPPPPPPPPQEVRLAEKTAMKSPLKRTDRKRTDTPLFFPCALMTHSLGS